MSCKYQYSLVVVASMAALLVAVMSPQLVRADFASDVKNAVNNVATSLSSAIDSLKDFACVVQNADKFNECSEIMDKFNNNKKVPENEVKDYCCAFHDTKVCVENVATDKCGAEAAKVIAEFMKKFTTNVLPEDCVQYDSFIACTDTTLLIAGAVIAGIILLTIVGCLVCCLKRVCC